MSFPALNDLPGSPTNPSLPLWTGGAAPSYTRINLAATVDPGAANDSSQGYGTFSFWLNTNTSTLWVCIASTAGNAVWQQVSGASPSTVSPIPSGANLVFEGDGYTSGVHASAGNTFPQQFMALPVASGRGTMTNYGTSTATIAQLATRYGTGARTKAPTLTGVAAYLAVTVGTDDFWTGTYADAPSYMAVLESYWAQAKTDGFKVVGFTIPPRNDSNGNPQDSMRCQINQLIRTSLVPDFVVDMECYLFDPADANLYNADTIYFVDKGYGVLARLMAIAIVNNGARVFGPLLTGSPIRASVQGDVFWQFRNSNQFGSVGLEFLDYLGAVQGNLVFINGQNLVNFNVFGEVRIAANGGTPMMRTKAGCVAICSETPVSPGPSLQVYKLSGGDGGTQAIYLSGGSASGPATIAAGAGAGTTPTVAVAGQSAAGLIGVTTGTTPTSSAVVATVTLGDTLPANMRVLLTPRNAATAALSGTAAVFVSAESTTTFAISVGSTALAGSTAYQWNYHIIQ